MVPKRGSSQRRVVMDLSFPPQSSVNSGIAASSYLNEPYWLSLPGIDRLCQFRHLLDFSFNGSLYFDTHCLFGLRTSAMICQRTTSAVIYIFMQHSYTADVYLDDF